MSPVLRGEAPPLPGNELRDLRERLSRTYADAVVPGPSGPILVIRVPHREPDFLRDLEAAVDVLPYRDLNGFRGVLLLGDRAHMGVSCDMLRALLEGREQAERDWVARQRVQLEPWAFHVGRMPSDPKRRLRAVFRADVESVEDLDEPDFDHLSEMLPSVKASSPGQTRPVKAYIVADVDHVTLDGAEFFSELERRRRRKRDAAERRRRAEIDDKHDLAVAHLSRILEKRGEAAPRPRFEPPPVEPPREARARTLPPVDVVRPERPGPMPSPASSAASAPSRPAELPPVRSPPAEDDPFRASARHPEGVAILRHAMQGAGYKLKERLMVRDQPIALAGARLEGYPTRVLVAFYGRLQEQQARTLLQTGRGVGAELVLAVAEDVDPGVERVTLATNLKVIRPDAIADVRFH